MGQESHLIGQVLQDTYLIERLLGKGNMGMVFEASHTRFTRRFAVKFLSSEFFENQETLIRFKREAQITSSFDHPHIVEVLDFNHTPDGMPYLIMELLQGEDLAERLKKRRCLELPEVASILHQTAEAMQVAHDKGVVHRDLKPQNIFLCDLAGRNDFVKVLDFGISKLLNAKSSLTRTQTLLGTPFYMSPEQAEEKAASVDHRTDIYSLGAILYEMLSGRPPVGGESIPTLLYKIVHQDPPSLRSLRPDVPIRVEEVIRRAMSKKPEDRYGSMEALWLAFSDALEPSAEMAIKIVTKEELELPTRVEPSVAPEAIKDRPNNQDVSSSMAWAPTELLAASNDGETRPELPNLSRPIYGRTTLSSTTGELQTVPEVRRDFSKRMLGALLGALLIFGIGAGLFFFRKIDAIRGPTEERGPAVQISNPVVTVREKDQPAIAAKHDPVAQRADAAASPIAEIQDAVSQDPASLKNGSDRGQKIAVPPRKEARGKRNTHLLAPKQTAVKQVEMATLSVSSPILADIYLDHILLGQTPLNKKVEPGRHVLQARWKGYRDQIKNVNLLPGPNNPFVFKRDR